DKLVTGVQTCALPISTRPPGQWQAYDIIFHRPHFKADSSVERPARMTVFFNGVLIQDNFELSGPTAHQRRPPYSAHADKLPLKRSEERRVGKGWRGRW